MEARKVRGHRRIWIVAIVAVLLVAAAAVFLFTRTPSKKPSDALLVYEEARIDLRGADGGCEAEAWPGGLA